MFPVAAYALKGIFKSRFNDPNSNEVKKWMVILLMIVLILFSIVKTKIVHYSSMAYFPVSFLATYAIYYIRNNRQKFSKWISGLNIFSALLFVFITAGLAFFKHIKPYVLESNILKDPFAEGNLEASANWTGFEWIAPAVLLVGLILYILMLKWNYTKAYIQITVFNALFIYAAILLFTPRVEEFSQKAAIDFYIEKQDERCYVETIGFKSYADLFYTRKKLSDKFYGGWQEMIQTTLDRPAYFVSKNTWKERILKKHDVKFLKEKNGFCFYLKPEMSSVSDTLKINNNNND
jgi:4-amino-4-deoxy-L-arabinose transferase-like glycosyltransferase